MKVLWITNMLFPPLCEKLGIKPPVVGGWMLALAQNIIKQIPEIEIAVASVSNCRQIQKYSIDNITYYIVPSCGSVTKYHSNLEKHWAKIQNEFCPQVVHIHGTEQAHGLAYINANGNNNVVSSIQGLVHVISRYYNNELSTIQIIKNLTFRDIITQHNLFQRKKIFIERGEIEKQHIKELNYIIGRTTWDKAHAIAINPSICYYQCNETLRPSFYKNDWSYNKCEKYSIFLSQATYPVKGLHVFIKAISLLIKSYPTLKVYIAGNNIIDCNWIYLSGYGKICRELIEKYNLKENFIFLGELTEEKMCHYYLKANVFVCPSSIENSPNSLCEAQILGLPSIASYVGGIPDFIENGKTGFLYRFEEYEMLAFYLDKVFKYDPSINTMASEAKHIAKKRHDPSINTENTIKIYKEIINNTNN